MACIDFEALRGEALPEGARQHLRECADCTAQRELTSMFGGLRGQLREASASPRAEAAVVAALPRRSSWRPYLALAAAALIAVTGWQWLGRRETPATPVARRYTDFFPLSPAAFAGQEASHVIRIRLPRGEMKRFGLPVQEGFERLSIEADVVVGQDGIARAVRFVR